MIIDRVPKISCLTVTNGRLELLKESIQCYLNQTYSKKELVVLSQGNDEVNQQIAQFISGLQRPDILFETAPQHLTLGAMRNASCELATGQILCQWDDDDLYHPQRLLIQYRAIRQDRQNIASAFTTFLKCFGNDVYWCDWSNEGCPSCKLLPGSVMFYKRYFHECQSLLYPVAGDQCHVEEDLNVLEKLLERGSVAPVWPGHMYMYVYHGGNTYNLPHHKLAIDTSSGKMVLNEEELLKRKTLIVETLRSFGVESANVHSLEGLAFTHEL